MSAEKTVEELVEEYLEGLRSGGNPDPEAFAAAHPAQKEELAGILRALEGVESVVRENGSAEDPGQPPELSGSDYRLLRKIGQGGMGAVWEAVQLSLNRLAAVKVLPAPKTRSAAWREMFENEARIVGQLHHPGIVKVYGAGTCGGTCYYAMELVEGAGFDRHVFASVRDAVRAAMRAAEALAYAHGCGIVHRDVKPSNLMVDASGAVLVTDFGLAGILASGTGVSGEGRCGTLRYMAPEMLDSGRGTFATDQYALGITLWETISGKPAFSGADDGAIENAIRTKTLPPPPGADADLAAVIAKATAKEPSDRYSGMAEFAADLGRWLDRRSVLAAPASPVRRLALWMRRNPALAALSCAVAVCVVALAAALAAGYMRTSAALRLAGRNAEVADAAIGEVFSHIESNPSFRSGTELLSALIPYYERLSGDKGIDPEKAADVDEVLGACAFRSGDYPLAEKSLSRLVAARPSAASMNRLAATLQKLGRMEDGAAMYRRVAGEYRESTNRLEKYEAALALESLSELSGKGKDAVSAFKIAGDLVAAEPANPSFRFLYARLLAHTGRFSQAGGENAFSLLSALASDYPDRPEYGIALVAAMESMMKNPRRRDSVNANDVELALDTADRLIGRYPNMPDAVSAVISFRDEYSNWLVRRGEGRSANQERIRTTGMLEMLAHGAESPDASRRVFKHGEDTIPYRQIIAGVPGTGGGTVILCLHDKYRNGSDNVRQVSAPFVRPITARAEYHAGQVAIVMPQCPGGRAAHWFGKGKKRHDTLLESLAELVRSKATEFGASPDRTFAVGVDSGAAACIAMAKAHPGLFGKVLAAGPDCSRSNAVEAAGIRIEESKSWGRKDTMSFVFGDGPLDWLFGE